MKSNFKSALLGFAAGLAVAAAGAQAAAQSTQHEHPAPPAQAPAAGAMKGMDGTKDMSAMMADSAMRQKMMANMAQCRDMMTMMMEHMGHGKELAKQPPTKPKH